MKRVALPFALLLAFCLVLAAGCGGKKSGTVLLKSEQRLAGMYEACKTIELTDGASKQTINTDQLKALGAVQVSAVLKRANGMQKPGTWSGAPLSAVLASKGVSQPYRELRIEAWDGYVGRVASDIAMRPDTILADTQDGKPIPREDGPVRLVVGSEDGFYWIRMITKIEVLR
jgi:DMSO/TMAO reductase YedYZ molybdopterin-dependent catalytic subunit